VWRVKIHGSCHCGNVEFDLQWPVHAETIPARACSCTFCRKHGARWTANASATLSVHINEPTLVTAYAFGTKTADFHVCNRCGVVACCTSLIEGRLYAVVNVNTFDDVNALLLVASDVNFDGEDESARVARRAANWIGDVRVTA
jgi:hypothetical protein